MDMRFLMELFTRDHHKIYRYLEHLFSGMPVGSTQVLLLLYLVKRSEQRDVFPKELAEFFQIRSSSITHLLNNLEETGYLQRLQTDQDRRLKRLVPTEKGKALEQEGQALVETFLEHTFRGLTPQQLKTMEEVLIQIDKNIDF